MSVGSPCRTYIVYRHELFAQGVRSVLAQQSGVQILGMENDVARAIKAVRALRPEVILVEEPTEHWGKWPFLQLAAAGRIVTLSLDHEFATIYDEHRIAAADPADLVKAITGVGKQQVPGSDRAHETVSVSPKVGSDRTTDSGRADVKRGCGAPGSPRRKLQ